MSLFVMYINEYIFIFTSSSPFSLQVFVNVIHVGVGAICQSDLDLAQATGACIVGFNVRTPPTSISLAAAQANIKVCALGQLIL